MTTSLPPALAVQNFHESDAPVFSILYHGSCRECHHSHTAKRIQLSSDPAVHVKVRCDHCDQPLFGVGRSSTHNSLVSSVLTLSTVNLSKSRRASTLALRTSSYPFQSPRSFSHTSSNQLSITYQGSRAPNRGSPIESLRVFWQQVSPNGGVPPVTQSELVKGPVVKGAKSPRRLVNRFFARVKNMVRRPARSLPEQPGTNISTVTTRVLEQISTGPESRSTLQQTIQEADETSPSATSPPRLQEQVHDSAASHSARSPYSLSIAHRRELALKRENLRLRVPPHCETCRCEERAGRAEPPVIAPGSLDTNNGASTIAPTSSAPTTRLGQGDMLHWTAHSGTHMTVVQPSVADSSNSSERRSSAAFSEAPTAIEGVRPSSRRAHSLPLREFMTFAAQSRPQVMDAIRNYDNDTMRMLVPDDAANTSLQGRNGQASTASIRIRSPSPLSHTSFPNGDTDTPRGGAVALQGTAAPRALPDGTQQGLLSDEMRLRIQQLGQQMEHYLQRNVSEE